jgi:hypothetical protein
MAKSRQKMLEKMADVPDASANDPTVKFNFPVPGILTSSDRGRLPYVARMV